MVEQSLYMRSAAGSNPVSPTKFMNKYDTINQKVRDLLAGMIEYHNYENACQLVLGYISSYSMGKGEYYGVPTKESKIALVGKLRASETYGLNLSNLQIAEIITILDEAGI